MGWARIFQRCTFVVEDLFDFTASVKDEEGIGGYWDTPWPDAGDIYSHRFGPEKIRRLEKMLRRFKKARVVVRYGDHPLIREIYTTDYWTIIEQPNRNQANNDAPELLIINGKSKA